MKSQVHLRKEIARITGWPMTKFTTEKYRGGSFGDHGRHGVYWAEGDEIKIYQLEGNIQDIQLEDLEIFRTFVK